MAILSLSDISKSFGGLKALAGVSFSVAENEIKGLIGPNGAGKTTLFNVVTGLMAPERGRITFRGRPITGLSSHKIAALGVARTFQNIKLFGSMSVLENVMVGRHTRSRAGFLAAAFLLPSAMTEEKAIRQKALEVLGFVGLGGYGEFPASHLPFGHQRSLEIARALAMEPRLILLDEPASGLNPEETATLGGLIEKVRSLGVTVVLVEHDMSLTMEVSDTIAVLDRGSLIAQGTPKEVQNDPAVIAAYLGEEGAA